MSYNANTQEKVLKNNKNTKTTQTASTIIKHTNNIHNKNYTRGKPT